MLEAAKVTQKFECSFQGYRNVMENCHQNAMVLKEGLEKTGRFNIVSKDIGVPLVAFSLKDNSRHNEFEIAETLRRFGWIVPAYTMPADAQHITVLRVVIREDFSRTLAERLVLDITKVLHELDQLPAKISAKVSVSTAAEQNGKNGAVVVKKTAIETQREITTYWKNFVIAKKSNKNTIC
ncbi:glutamate decarboxylase, putative [Ricinus communis]|uniref:Glutamate decarboxylase, putative n=1 Tax=Ricinus communis TaxID=3988 RepID=B9S7C3_RICCO|nr:glutamate decarboxylase, putative [Ricinus communis]